MKTFQEFRTTSPATKLSEAFKAKAGEKVVKTFKVGKNKKYDAVITKKGSQFIAYIDGDELDTFKSQKDAESGIKDFTDLMGK
jgi:hypothetical protein